MAVKVLIERWVKAGHEAAVWEMLRDMRSMAVRQRGYLYGETWRSLDNPRIFMVASTWGRREYWESRANDEFRRKMEERIGPMLRRPTSPLRGTEDRTPRADLLKGHMARDHFGKGGRLLTWPGGDPTR